MRKLILVVGIGITGGGGCFQGSFNPKNQRPQGAPSHTSSSNTTLDQTSQDVEVPIATEPVPISGSYLTCAYTNPEQSAAACRIEDQSQQKIALPRLDSRDVQGFDSKGKRVDISFALAPSYSFWHWIADRSVKGLPIASMRLNERFKSDTPDDRSSLLLPHHPLLDPVLTPNPSYDDRMARDRVGPPGPIRPVGADAVASLVYSWFQADVGLSCEQFCASRGGVVEEVSAAWAQDPSFCLQMFEKLYPDRAGRARLVRVPDTIGMGCFTEGADEGSPNVYAETSAFFDKDASTAESRRFCSCLNNN